MSDDSERDELTNDSIRTRPIERRAFLGRIAKSVGVGAAAVVVTALATSGCGGGSDVCDGDLPDDFSVGDSDSGDGCDRD